MKIGSLNNTGDLRCGESAGSSRVIVQNIETQNNTVSEELHVVEPHALELNIREDDGQCFEHLQMRQFRDRPDPQFDNNFHLILNRRYCVKAVVIDENRNVITIAKNVVFEYSFPKTHFKVLEVNNYQAIIEPIALERRIQVDCQLKSILLLDSTGKNWEPR
jgi:hypothetical protein